jgi:hypothetical protein
MGAVGNVLDAEPVVAELVEELLGRVEDGRVAIGGSRSAPAASDRRGRRGAGGADRLGVTVGGFGGGHRLLLTL